MDGEQKFHISRVAFMIIEDKIIYLNNSKLSHIEWYNSLNYDLDKFDAIVRGYYRDGKIVFYKGDFEYDEEVIENAKRYGNEIREYVENKNAEVYVGVIKGKVGEIWPPKMKIEI